MILRNMRSSASPLYVHNIRILYLSPARLQPVAVVNVMHKSLDKRGHEDVRTKRKEKIIIIIKKKRLTILGVHCEPIFSSLCVIVAKTITRTFRTRRARQNGRTDTNSNRAALENFVFPPRRWTIETKSSTCRITLSYRTVDGRASRPRLINNYYSRARARFTIFAQHVYVLQNVMDFIY